MDLGSHAEDYARSYTSRSAGVESTLIVQSIMGRTLEKQAWLLGIRLGCSVYVCIRELRTVLKFAIVINIFK